MRADRDKISMITWQQILKVVYLNPFNQLCLLIFVLKINPFQLNDNLLIFHSHARNDGNVLAPEFEYHLCIFVNHEVHNEREEKQEERQERLVLILRYFSSLRALRELRGATRLQPKAEMSK